MYFVGFWRFKFDKCGLCGSEFVPVAFFCERKHAVEFARSWAAEHISSVSVVFDLETQKASYFSLFQHQQETENFKQSVVYCSSLDCDMQLGIYANQGTLFHQLRDSLTMFHFGTFSERTAQLGSAD